MKNYNLLKKINMNIALLIIAILLLSYICYKKYTIERFRVHTHTHNIDLKQANKKYDSGIGENTTTIGNNVDGTDKHANKKYGNGIGENTTTIGNNVDETDNELTGGKKEASSEVYNLIFGRWEDKTGTKIVYNFKNELNSKLYKYTIKYNEYIGSENSKNTEGTFQIFEEEIPNNYQLILTPIPPIPPTPAIPVTPPILPILLIPPTPPTPPILTHNPQNANADWVPEQHVYSLTTFPENNAVIHLHELSENKLIQLFRFYEAGVKISYNQYEIVDIQGANTGR